MFYFPNSWDDDPIKAKNGKLKRHLSQGFRDGHGNWHNSRAQVAIAWQKQFADIENAEEVTFESLLARSAPQCSPLDSSVLPRGSQCFWIWNCFAGPQSMKAPGLDGIWSRNLSSWGWPTLPSAHFHCFSKCLSDNRVSRHPAGANNGSCHLQSWTSRPCHRTSSICRACGRSMPRKADLWLWSLWISPHSMQLRKPWSLDLMAAMMDWWPFSNAWDCQPQCLRSLFPMWAVGDAIYRHTNSA